MSDFSKPEYASYVALCRELRLERDWKEGDWYHLRHIGREFLLLHDATDWPDSDASWLPSLSDWLEMLEEFDDHIGFWAGGDESEDGWSCYIGSGEPTSGSPRTDLSYGLTREEACAHLWMARKPALAGKQ